MSIKKISSIVIIIIVATAAWYFGAPLFLDTEINEEFPTLEYMPTPEELASMDPADLEVIKDAVMDMAAKQPDSVTEELMPNTEITPLVLAMGVFQDADNFHKGSGRAGIYQLPNGSRILRFEDFSVTNGPDLRVLLSESAQPKTSGDLGEYIELARLKGNKGDQNYEIPADADISSFASVVIYCKPFHVVFSVAPFAQ